MSGASSAGPTGGASGGGSGGGILGLIEWMGNKLPDPVFLFLGATALVFVLSAVGSSLGWSVQPQKPKVVMETVTVEGKEVTRPKVSESGRPEVSLVADGSPVKPWNMLSADGVYWLGANMIRNFINFPPLGVVLVGMFGIGLAEKVGLFGALLKWMATKVSSWALTPTIVFLGVVSNVASDAGYLVLPPLAAGLYVLFGRPPLAGVAAAFAGVSAGFSANLLVGSTDALVGGITETGARVLDPSYSVKATANWWFMAGSTGLLTLLGWAVTAWIVEPRLAAAPGPLTESETNISGGELTPTEVRGLRGSVVAAVLTLGGLAALIFVPGAPLHGNQPAAEPRFGPIPVKAPAVPGVFQTDGVKNASGPTPGTVTVAPGFALEAKGKDSAGQAVAGTFSVGQEVTMSGAIGAAPKPQPRWSQAVVPMILVAFLVPGVVYGVMTGVLRTQSQVSKAFIGSMADMAPVIALAFFAAQFIASFQQSQLDRMLAFSGGRLLVESGLPTWALVAGIVALTMTVNLLMSSMSAKWSVLAPILVPMMMMAGMSPELTQGAYRVGDSVTNIVTPLNSYAIVILAAMQRHKKNAGMGNLIAMMVPYSAVFAVVWTLFLLGWVWLGLPMGPGAPMWYVPVHH